MDLLRRRYDARAPDQAPAERAQSTEARVQADAGTRELGVVQGSRHTGDEIEVSALRGERRIHSSENTPRDLTPDLRSQARDRSRRRHVIPLDGTWPTFARRPIVCSWMRLLVIAASALAVAASATAGNNQITASCAGSQLRIAVQSAGENT